MSSDPFRFNIDAKYEPGHQKDAAGDVGNPSEGRVQVKYMDPNGWFEAKYPDVFENYKLPQVKTNQIVETWKNHPMQFWQNQLNFAVWCATTGCGVSYEKHLSSDDDLVKSLYRFHLYYQVRRILVEMKAKQPQDNDWNAMNNSYNRRAYEKICDEFGVKHNTDWRLAGLNHGLGRAYYYFTHIGYRLVEGSGVFNPDYMSFTKDTTNTITHVDYIEQDSDVADKAWITFIIAKSKGFTKPGVERLNDSIRTYVWAILAAQVDTTTGILGTGMAFDAQKQFLVNVKAAISSDVGLPPEIDRYRSALRHARSVVNFSFGEGLYMAPSDMLLRVGVIANYSDLILVATDAQSLGLNSGLNKSEAPTDAENDTGEEGLVKPDRGPRTTQPQSRKSWPTRVGNSDHEDEKTALVVAGVAVGLLALWVIW